MKLRPSNNFILIALLFTNGFTTINSQTYNTPVIDGNDNDWLQIFGTTATGGSDGSQWFYTWDHDNFYFAFLSNLLPNYSFAQLIFFFDSDPKLNPVQGTGSTIGPVIGTQQISLPFTSNYYVKWRAGANYVDAFIYQGGQWMNIEDEGGVFNANVSFGLQNQFVEFSIARSSLNSTFQLQVCGCVIDTRSKTNFGFSPAGNFSLGVYPSLNFYQFFGFILTPMIFPNFAGHLNSYPTATTNNGDFSNPAVWYGNQKPGNTAIAYIGHQITTSAVEALQHLVILQPGSLIAIEQSQLTMSNGFIIQTDGVFAHNGTILLNSGTIRDTTGQTPIQFNHVNVYGTVNFGSTTSVRGQFFVNGSSEIMSPVTYEESSVLIYFANGAYPRGQEWLSAAGGNTKSVPYSVFVQGGTTLALAAESVDLPLEIQDLSVDVGCNLLMEGMTAPLIIDGNLVNRGSITMSSMVNGSAYLEGVPISLGSLACDGTPTLYLSGTPWNQPTITASGPLILNYGSSVVLDAGSGYINYIWTPGNFNTRSITVNTTGNYSVMATSPGGCFAYSTQVSVTVLPPVTTSFLTTSPMTTSPLTTSPLTTGEITTSPLTTGEVTSAEMTTSPLTSADMTTSPLTSADMTTSEVTSSPLTTSPLTTSPLTTSPLTTAEPYIPPPPPKNNKAIIGAVLGTVGVLIVVLIPIIIVLRRKRARKAEEQEVLLKAIY